MPTVLRVENLWKSYAAGVRGCSARVWALRGCSLEIARGERIAIVGARGAGKSTLLRCIAGEHRVDAGRVEVTLPIRCCFSANSELTGARARSANTTLLLLDNHDHSELIARAAGTVVVAARDVASIQGLVDRILLLRDGRLTPLTRLAVRRVAERAIQ